MDMKKTFSKPMYLQDILAHRQFIYGISALWILFYHMNSAVPSRGIFRFLRLIQETGTCGVEVFLFLTGYGLYGALNRNPDVGRFYRRRLTRVLIPALVLVLGCDLIVCSRLFGYRIDLPFLLTWPWSGRLWYVSFILVAYLVYPLLHRWIRPGNQRVWLAAIAVSFAATFILGFLPFGIPKEILRTSTRIPVFLLGCMLSPAIEENRPLPRRSLLCLLLASGIGVFLWKVAKRAGYMYSMRMFAFLFLGAAVILMFTLLAQNLQKHNFGRRVYRIFWFCGSISLEIYLVFDRVRELLEFVPGIKGLPSYGMDLLAAVLTIPLAWLLRRLCTAIANGLTAIGKFGESRRCACKK